MADANVSLYLIYVAEYLNAKFENLKYHPQMVFYIIIDFRSRAIKFS